jgi:excinuclease ABC subunit A
VETALKWGGNRIVVLRQSGNGVVEKWSNEKSNTLLLQHFITPAGEWEAVRYTTDYGNPESDFSLGELTPKHFSFNSHFGACPACHGLGTQLVCDADLMVSDHSLAPRHETDAGVLPQSAKRAR